MFRYEASAAKWPRPGRVDATLVALLRGYYLAGDSLTRVGLLDWLEEHGDRRANLIRWGSADGGKIRIPQDRTRKDWMHDVFPELDFPRKTELAKQGPRHGA